MLEDERHEDQETMQERQNQNPLIRIGVMAAVVVVIAIAGTLALVSNHHQEAAVAQLNAQEGAMNARIATLQDQLKTAQDQLTTATQALNETAAKHAADQTKTQATKVAAAKRPAARRSTVDPRLKQLQDRVDAQQKQLDATTDAINQTRSDLQGNIRSTRDELNGSIAKNHDELVALEQRGERSYYEFDLSKGKSFDRTGPISVSLRKTDAKHKHYDVALLVDDNEIQKKNVDLYEPIWLRNSDDPQPLEIVVNKVDKNHIHGYVSASKYTQAQLTRAVASAGTTASQTPATVVPSAPAGNTQSN